MSKDVKRRRVVRKEFLKIEMLSVVSKVELINLVRTNALFVKRRMQIHFAVNLFGF